MWPHHTKQSGAAIIEFALSFALFWTIFMATLEFSRAMYAWNFAQEATRLGARYASICSDSGSQQNIIRQKVQEYITSAGNITLPSGTGWLTFSYYPSGCISCESVEVKLNNLKIDLLIPFSNLQLTLPEFKTLVLRESMSNTITYSDGATEGNPLCN